jgi:hypothetical protein
MRMRCLIGIAAGWMGFGALLAVAAESLGSEGPRPSVCSAWTVAFPSERPHV